MPHPWGTIKFNTILWKTAESLVITLVLLILYSVLKLFLVTQLNRISF